MMKRNLKPEAEYHVNSETTLSDINKAYQECKPITGKVIGYNTADKTLMVFLGNENIGILPWNEATIYQFSYPKRTYEATNIPIQISAILYKTIRVRVTEINGNTILLSRKKNMLEAARIISSYIGSNFRATVIGKYKYGVFFDIGEGVTAFCHITEFSETHISDIGSWVSLGERHIVKLIAAYVDGDYKFSCSRKRAYPAKYGYEAFEPDQIVRAKVSCPVYQNGKLSGYFVELNPIVTGIADVRSEIHTFRTGDVVTVYIKSVSPEKRRIRMKIIIA